MPLIFGLLYIAVGLGMTAAGGHMIVNRKKWKRERDEDREMRARELVALETRNELEIQRRNGVASIKNRRKPKEEGTHVEEESSNETEG